MLNRTFTWVLHHRRWVLFLCLVLTVGAGLGMRRLTIRNRFTEWLPAGDPVYRLFLETGETFHANNLVMVALRARQGETFAYDLLTRLDRLTRALARDPAVSHVVSITNITDIRPIPDGIQVEDFLRVIPRAPADLRARKAEALSRENLVDRVISRDGRWLALAVYLRSDVDEVAAFRDVVRPLCQQYLADVADIFYAGEPPNTYFANQYALRDLRRLVPVTVVLIGLILFGAFRRPGGVFLPLLVVLIATLWTFGVMGWLGTPINILAPVIPVLLIALGSAYGIHVYNRLVHTPTHPGPGLATRAAATAEVAVPVALAGLTTLIGFLSFVTARLKLIIEFGLYAALGIAFATVLALLLVPILADPPGVAVSERSMPAWPRTFLDRLLRPVQRRAPWFALVPLGLMVLFALAIPRIERHVDFAEYFPPDSLLRRSLTVINRHFGGAYPLTLYIRAPHIDAPEVLRIMRHAGRFLGTLPEAGNPFSVVDFIEEMNYYLNGFYAVPETPGGVANLWFFMEGRRELDQLVTPDLDAALVMTTVSRNETRYMRRIQQTVARFLAAHIRPGFVRYDLRGQDPATAARVRRHEARWLTREMAWLAEYYVHRAVDPEAIVRRLLPLVAHMPGPDDPDVVRTARAAFSAYVASDAFEFFLDRDHQQRLVAGLVRVLAQQGVDPDAFAAVLARVVPSTEYDPELAADAAATLALRAREAQRSVFVDRALRDLAEVLAIDSSGSDDYRKKVRGLLFDLADDLAVVPRVPGLPEGGTVVELAVDQSGYPSVLTRLDRFLFRSQVQSLGLALGLTFLLMVALRRSLLLGTISVAPIAFTVAVVYGFLGLTGIPLDYATMMIASISIGVGIDYSIHVVHGIVVRNRPGTRLAETVRAVILEKGVAILANSVAIIAGFLVLLLSSMTPLRHFGATMAGSMFLAAAAALTLLPALILWIQPLPGGRK